MVPGLYDGIEFPSISFKPADDEVGAKIEFTLTNVRQIEIVGQDGKRKTGVCLEGTDDDGAVRDWVAWNLSNKTQVREANAQLGDRLRVVHLGRDKGAKNPATAARLFTVEVVK
jgi:hypothetical protein